MNEHKKGTSSTEGMRRSVETSDLLKVNNEGYVPQIKAIKLIDPLHKRNQNLTNTYTSLASYRCFQTKAFSHECEAKDI